MKVTMYAFDGGGSYGASPVTLTFDSLEWRDRTGQYVGEVVSFDVANGDDWSSGEKGIDRYIMEGVAIQYMDFPRSLSIMGFVHVRKFGKEADRRTRDELVIERNAVCRQRWDIEP